MSLIGSNKFKGNNPSSGRVHGSREYEGGKSRNERRNGKRSDASRRFRQAANRPCTGAGGCHEHGWDAGQDLGFNDSEDNPVQLVRKCRARGLKEGDREGALNPIPGFLNPGQGLIWSGPGLQVL